jgi:beta-glucosidase
MHTKIKLYLFTLLLLITLLITSVGIATAQPTTPPYRNPDLPIEERVADLLGRMSLAEKIGQMTLVEKGSISPQAVADYYIGAVLSGGGGYPTGNNTPQGWMDMVHAYQDAALSTPLAIPMLYGVDAVHGHSNLYGAVIFPHNIGLGATRNPDLVEQIGRITAREMIATGIYWNYAPAVSVPQDVRWGRTYEGFSENTELVTLLATAMLRGLQGEALGVGESVLATPKHFIGDGGTRYGTSPQSGGLLDRGITDIDEPTLRAIHLPPYIAAIENGARNIMISYSSWGGMRMHGQAYLIQDVLINELGFSGFIVSDWAGMDDVAPNYYDAVVASVNAGVDMNMVPYDYRRFINTMTEAVNKGDIPLARIDQAVSNILRVKFELGLFEHPYGNPDLIPAVGSDEHRAVARQAVRESLVLLKNQHNALPLQRDATQTVFIAGAGADNIGIQAGGWTIEWQGVGVDGLPGTTLLDALQAGFGANTTIRYDQAGDFGDARADLGIIVIGEEPYAEWFGDDPDLSLGGQNLRLINKLRQQVDRLIIVLYSGRPMVIDTALNMADAFVAAWLPGSEGAGIADVLFGDADFVGKLPYTWLRHIDQLPFDFANIPTTGCDAPLFPFGYGLSYADTTAAAPWLALAEDCAPALDDMLNIDALPVIPLPSNTGDMLVNPDDMFPHIPRQVMYIPYPVPITLDGDLSDWNGIPFEVVDKGVRTSTNIAENGFFQWALAADDDTLYIYMVMPDATIVTGEHGTDFWNEDSMEFYLNFSGDLARTSYGEGVFQVNINPGNIGNTDPNGLVFTGVNSSQAVFSAYVFRIEGGWGFEAAVKIPDSITVAHGTEIGVQAHANGSSGGSRDVKLIWSAKDTSDTSYQNPSVFGRGIFYEMGNPSKPEPTVGAGEAPIVAVIEPKVAINQVGYFVGAPHYAMMVAQGNYSTAWSIIDNQTGEMVYAGLTGAPVFDEASGDLVYIIDFSRFNTPGTYRLMVNSIRSDPFTIGEGLYDQLAIDAARYFYLNRSGIELLPQFAGERYARPAGHLTDDNVTCYRGTDAQNITWDGCDYTLNARGGWYDAGDYGKYVVNGGISLWTLHNLYERLPEAYGDGRLNIPESGNGIADILDEARWQMQWMLSMQVPDGYPQAGMVHHKLHDLQWEGFPSLPHTEFDNNNTFAPGNGRYVYPPSTAATYNLAATAAQCARIWRGIDEAFADTCLNAAVIAFDAGMNNPIAIAGNTPGAGGGNYDDTDIRDELFWAAAELFITTGDARYYQAMQTTPYLGAFAGIGKNSAMYWGDVASLGALSLILHQVDLPEVATLRQQVVAVADEYLTTIRTEGYRLPIREYAWGSNSAVLNNAIILAYAHDITGDAQYLYGMTESMDYLLGRNALAFSFISGYGTRAMTNPHHRFWANQPNIGYPPPPPGVVAGGPNAEPSDPVALQSAELDKGPARRYVDLSGSWSTNEVTINWNAPLAWVTAYLAQVRP